MPRILRNPKQASKQFFLGIDPGKSGGIVVLDAQGLSVDWHSMPTTTLDLFNVFKHINCYYDIRACTIEKVQSMPNEGHKGAFTFGWGCGRLETAVIFSGIPLQLVTPQAWQKALGIPTKKKTEQRNEFKERLRDFAQKLFPKLELWERPRSKGLQMSVCDAILIAEYTRRKYADRENLYN